MWNEFKRFALKGSMIDLAIGIIIGGAVGKVITSFVNDILMPPIGLLLGASISPASTLIWDARGIRHSTQPKLQERRPSISACSSERSSISSSSHWSFSSW